MAAMLGIVTADNLLLLVVFWELTSIASFLLIGFWDERADARAGAYQSLIVTALGGLALLAGVLVLGLAARTFELGTLRDARGRAAAGCPSTSIALAPDPARRVHEVGAGPVPLLAAERDGGTHAGERLPAFGDDGEGRRLPPRPAVPDLRRRCRSGRSSCPVAGGITMLVGGWAALRHTDLKRLLAYSTVSQLGLLTLLYGLGTDAAAVAATVHVLSHATFKAALFMIAGIVDHETEHARHRASSAAWPGTCRAPPRSRACAAARWPDCRR